MKLAKYVKFREEKFGGVLFETRSEKVFALNPTATAIVREIAAGGCDEPGLVARLQGCFNGGGGAIEREVAAFVGDLRNQGLLED
jgi:Coenzyme PQQ synthesis protein D (PqqD)